MDAHQGSSNTRTAIDTRLPVLVGFVEIDAEIFNFSMLHLNVVNGERGQWYPLFEASIRPAADCRSVRAGALRRPGLRARQP
jgi:hypothetical protein